jgi:signal peptidase I
VVTTKAVPEPIIKRVIAVAGQTVNIDYVHNKVYVGDGKTMKAINEPFIKEPMQQAGDIKLPAKVPPHCIFVMGDNRNNSKDSRFSDVGMINDNDILGRAVFRIYPIDELGLLH